MPAASYHLTGEQEDWLGQVFKETGIKDAAGGIADGLGLGSLGGIFGDVKGGDYSGALSAIGNVIAPGVGGAIGGLAGSFIGGGDPSTNQHGPGSQSYWRGQIERMQVITGDPDTSEDLRERVHAFTRVAKATDANDAIKGGYPQLDPAVMDAFEREYRAEKASRIAGGTPAGNGSSVFWIVGAVVAAVAIGFALLMKRRK